MKQLAWQSAAVATHETETVEVFIDLGDMQICELPVVACHFSSLALGYW